MGSKPSSDRPASAPEKARQSFRDEADKAWLDYERTGRYATQAEVEAWANSLGTGKPQRLRALSDAQRQELRERLAHHRANPDEPGSTLDEIRRKLIRR